MTVSRPADRRLIPKGSEHEKGHPGKLVVDGIDHRRSGVAHHRPEHVMRTGRWRKEVLPPVPLAVLAGCGLVFLFVRLGEISGLSPWWAAGYLDDLICLPLVLGAVLVGHRLRGRSPRFRLPAVHGAVAFIIFCLYFEVLLPRVDGGFTADPWDVVMYALGLVLFQLGVNRPRPGSVSPA